MIARTSTTDVIASGMGGTRNGSLQLVSYPSVLSTVVSKISTIFGGACLALNLFLIHHF